MAARCFSAQTTPLTLGTTVVNTNPSGGGAFSGQAVLGTGLFGASHAVRGHRRPHVRDGSAGHPGRGDGNHTGVVGYSGNSSSQPPVGNRKTGVYGSSGPGHPKQGRMGPQPKGARCPRQQRGRLGRLLRWQGLHQPLHRVGRNRQPQGAEQQPGRACTCATLRVGPSCACGSTTARSGSWRPHDRPLARSLASLDLGRGVAAVRLAAHGAYRFDDLWVGLAEGPEFDDYASGSGQYAEQALRRLSDRLRERRGPTTG